MRQDKNAVGVVCIKDTGRWDQAVLVRGRLDGQRQERRCDDGSRRRSDVGPRAKGCRQPLETAKAKKERDSLLELPEGTRPCQPILDF